MTWTLEIPEVPPSGNLIMRMHWTTYHRILERWYMLVRSAAGFMEIPTAAGPRRVTVVRHGRGKLDGDNLAFSTKPIFDCLRPSLVSFGKRKSGANVGRVWSSARLGHGLILEDDEAHVERVVSNGALERGRKPWTSIQIEDLPGIQITRLAPSVVSANLHTSGPEKPKQGARG